MAQERIRRGHRSPDVNVEVAGLLFDLFTIQQERHRRIAYRRAARAVFGLDRPLTSLLEGNQIRRVRYLGPATERIIREYLETGRSETVEAAVQRSGQAALIAARRELRRRFLSNAAVEEILTDQSPRLVGPANCRGDFQMHSEWSDGAEPIAVMIEACLQRGHRCACMTDHSYGLPIARGMSVGDIRRQHRQIDRLNAKYAGRFRVFKGIEANILRDGTLDMTGPELQMMELVVASPHTALSQTVDQTDRMRTAVSQRGVTILGHPRGRLFGRRGGVMARWPEVFEIAARRRVAIEIDGTWDRQDIDFDLARQALEQGCLFAVDSDAHSVEELEFQRYALAHARLAGIPPERVINCWDEATLLEWSRGAWDR